MPDRSRPYATTSIEGRAYGRRLVVRHDVNRLRSLADPVVNKSTPTPFPTLTFDSAQEWDWPSPPFEWPHLPAPAKGTPQRCSIEGLAGEQVRAEMLDFDPAAKKLTVRGAADGSTGLLAFSRFRRLTLVEPLRAAPRSAGAPSPRIPAARRECDYTLWAGSDAPAPPLTGRTAGHVQTAAGLFLFTPVEEETALQRVFVPRCALSRCEFGPSAEEIAAAQWIGSQDALLEAIERQQRMPVMPIGQSVLALGLLTQAQLDRELAKPAGDVPLGESLVAAGLISPADLHMVIAHKMGYPMVDLTRFPIDPSALARLPKGIAARHRIVPLMIDNARLIVAVDRPSRVLDLRSLHTPVQTSIVAVLASALQITVALDRLSRDAWSQQVVGRPSFVRTTR
jgi:hypothetical protein